MVNHGEIMLKTGVLQVVARGPDVTFVIDEDAPFEIVAGNLREYLAKQSGLWSKGEITVNVGQRMLAREELAEVKSIIETHSGLTVTRFWCSPDSLGSGEIHIEAKPLTSANPAKTAAHNDVVLPEPPPGPPPASSVESVI